MPVLGALAVGRRRGEEEVVVRQCRCAEKGLSNFEEQDASWGEGERDYGEEERGGGGEGYWEGGREVGRSRTGV